MTTKTATAQWHLLYCKAGQEQRAAMHLANQGVHSFFPQVQVEKIVRGKRLHKQESLFPCYLFALIADDANFNAIRSTRGIRDFVRFGQRFAIVNNELVTYLQERKMLQSEIAVLEQANNLPKLGDKVRVNNAVFKDVEAIFLRTEGEERCILLIKLLQQEAEIEVSNKDLSALS